MLLAQQAKGQGHCYIAHHYPCLPPPSTDGSMSIWALSGTEGDGHLGLRGTSQPRGTPPAQALKGQRQEVAAGDTAETVPAKLSFEN